MKPIWTRCGRRQDKLASSAALSERRFTDARHASRGEVKSFHRCHSRISSTSRPSYGAAKVPTRQTASDSDENMKSMLAAKERIIDRAKERAQQIEDEAQNQPAILSPRHKVKLKARWRIRLLTLLQQRLPAEPITGTHESVALAKKEAAVVLARAEQRLPASCPMPSRSSSRRVMPVSPAPTLTN